MIEHLNHQYNQMIRPDNFVKNFNSMWEFEEWCYIGTIEDLQATLVEFEKYLELHPEITNWVAIDDLNMSPEANGGYGLENFVLTPRSSEWIKQCGIKEKLLITLTKN